MKKKFMFSISLFTLLSGITTFAMSQCEEPCAKPEVINRCEPCKPCCTELPTTVCPANAAYNGPARIDIACGWDMYISGSFVYWLPSEKGMELGTLQKETTANNITDRTRKIIDLDHKYKPGFKVSLGFSSDSDDWELYGEYTRFYSTIKQSKRIDLDGAYSLTSHWFDITDDTYYANYLKGVWKLEIDLIDIELSRPYYLGQKVTVKPTVGLRGGWIDQKYNATITGREDVTENVTGTATNKSDSWLIGPRFGVDTSWLLGEGFRFFGNLAGSLFYQDFKVRIKQNYPEQAGVPSTTNYYNNADGGYIIPNLDCGLGFGYGTYFANNAWHFDLVLGYDFNIFWNQNQMRATDDLLTGDNDDGYPGHLTLHGLTATIRLDF